MTAIIPPLVEMFNPTIGGLPKISRQAQDCAMTDARTEFPEIGQRLRSIREGFSDLNQSEWAERNSFGVTQWNNWEKGARRISVDAAERLCSTYGVSLDFIYLGRRDGLSDKASKVV